MCTNETGFKDVSLVDSHIVFGFDTLKWSESSAKQYVSRSEGKVYDNLCAIWQKWSKIWSWCCLHCHHSARSLYLLYFHLLRFSECVISPVFSVFPSFICHFPPGKVHVTLSFPVEFPLLISGLFLKPSGQRSHCWHLLVFSKPPPHPLPHLRYGFPRPSSACLSSCCLLPKSQSSLGTFHGDIRPPPPIILHQMWRIAAMGEGVGG